MLRRSPACRPTRTHRPVRPSDPRRSSTRHAGHWLGVRPRRDRRSQRVAYVGVLADQLGTNCAAFLQRAIRLAADTWHHHPPADERQRERLRVASMESNLRGPAASGISARAPILRGRTGRPSASSRPFSGSGRTSNRTRRPGCVARSSDPIRSITTVSDPTRAWAIRHRGRGSRALRDEQRA